MSFFDNPFAFDDSDYNPFDNEDGSLEEWLNSPANRKFEKIMQLSDKIIKEVTTENQFEIFFLRTLILYCKNDYKKARRMTENIFKRLYIEEQHDVKLDQIIEEQEKEIIDENKIDKLYGEIGLIPEDVDESQLDDIETIDDFLDKLDENPDTEN